MKGLSNSMKKMHKKYSAFTLAEILVSLTIIGVVAALTISNVMINVNAAQARASLKKAISSLNQAILTNATEDGFDCAETIGAGEQSLYDIIETRLQGRALTANDDTDERWFIYANYISSPVDVSQTNMVAEPVVSEEEVIYPYAPDGSHDYRTRYYSLPDGMTLIMPPNMVSCGNPRLLNNGGIPTTFTGNANTACIGFIDINGSKGPNQVVGCEARPADIEADANEYILPEPGAARICEIKEKGITDVFPILFYNDRVFPATYAAMSVYMDALQED